MKETGLITPMWFIVCAILGLQLASLRIDMKIVEDQVLLSKTVRNAKWFDLMPEQDYQGEPKTYGDKNVTDPE